MHTVVLCPTSSVTWCRQWMQQLMPVPQLQAATYHTAISNGDDVVHTEPACDMDFSRRCTCIDIHTETCKYRECKAHATLSYMDRALIYQAGAGACHCREWMLTLCSSVL